MSTAVIIIIHTLRVFLVGFYYFSRKGSFPGPSCLSPLPSNLQIVWALKVKLTLHAILAWKASFWVVSHHHLEVDGESVVY